MATRERITVLHPVVQRVAHGKGTLFFSIPFLGGGVLVGLVGLRVIEVDPSTVHAPYPILAVTGGLFALAGLTILVHAVRGMLHRSRRESMRRLHPDRPWLADWSWDRRGTRDEPWLRVGSAWFGFALFALFLVPFWWWAFLSGHGPWMVKGMVGLFALIAVGVGVGALRRTLQALRYGTSYVVFEDFPFRLGGEVHVRFGPCRYERLHVALECIEEKFETRGSGRDRSTTNVMDRLWREERTLELAPALPEVALRFRLPDDPSLATDFSGVPIRYWRLRVTADVPGVDLDTSLLVPVYGAHAPAPEPVPLPV